MMKAFACVLNRELFEWTTYPKKDRRCSRTDWLERIYRLELRSASPFHPGASYLFSSPVCKAPCVADSNPLLDGLCCNTLFGTKISVISLLLEAFLHAMLEDQCRAAQRLLIAGTEKTVCLLSTVNKSFYRGRGVRVVTYQTTLHPPHLDRCSLESQTAHCIAFSSWMAITDSTKPLKLCYAPDWLWFCSGSEGLEGRARLGNRSCRRTRS